MSLGFAPSMLLLGMPDFPRSNLQLRKSSLLLLPAGHAGLPEEQPPAAYLEPAPSAAQLRTERALTGSPGLLQHLLSLIVYAQQNLRLGPSCMLHLLRSFALRSLLARSSLAPGPMEPPPFA